VYAHFTLHSCRLIPSQGTPVIYVNFNYRLNIFGFPTGTEAKQAGATNLGLKDQLAALQWVHNNINSFGGDNAKVCLSGSYNLMITLLSSG
jgi:carboxylesterase type B